jgi:polysaccharide pyruvyl transferase WcaK-like protein
MGRMGLDTTHDAIYPDVVFSLPVAGAERTATGAVGVGVMDYCGRNADRHRDSEIRADYTDKITRFALWLVDNGRTVRLFTTDSVADGRVVEAVVAGVRERRPSLAPARVIAEPVPSLEDLMRQTASVDTVVATRYHNVLFALLMGKPAISLSYASKSDKLMAEMGLSRFTQPVKELDVGRLIQQFTELEKDSAQLRPVIAERIAAKAKLVEDQFSDLSETLFPVDEEAHPVGEYTHGQQATQQRPHQHPW